jgi:hypothetical protein
VTASSLQKRGTGMTARTRRLRELLAGDQFLYMPSCAVPLEGRLAEAAGCKVIYTGGYVSGASRFMKRALAEMIATGNSSQVSDADFVTLRKEIEDLIGLDVYYRIEAETVEPDSRPG